MITRVGWLKNGFVLEVNEHSGGIDVVMDAGLSEAERALIVKACILVLPKYHHVALTQETLERREG